MRATRSSMSTFRRPPLSIPPHSRRILQRLPKRRRFGSSTGPLFLGWLTYLLKEEQSIASVCGPLDELLLQIHRRAYPDASSAGFGSDAVLVQEFFPDPHGDHVRSARQSRACTREPPEATILSWMSWRNCPATQATLCASTTRCR